MLRIFSKSFLIAISLTLILSGCGSFNKASFTSRSSRLPDFSQEKSAGLEDISIAAIGLVGVPYRWGGNTPAGGFDCSGLVVYVVDKTRNKKIPRTTTEMGKFGYSLDDKPPAPGDLVFFNTQGDSHSHVGIYVGKGRFVHAPSTGGTVRLDDIKTPYWSARYTEARRVVAN